MKIVKIKGKKMDEQLKKNCRQEQTIKRRITTFMQMKERKWKRLQEQNTRSGITKMLANEGKKMGNK